MGKRKRTRKEKIIASLRRQVRNSSLDIDKKTVAPDIQNFQEKEIQEKKIASFSEFPQIRKDLTKSLLLSMLVIVLELVVYFSKILD